MKIEKNNGFTLIELLLTMAIISILSGAILVSISSQRQRAYQSRMLAELSGTIQPMLMCRTDGNTVVAPDGDGGEPICSGLPAYGTWPTPSSGFTYTHGGDFNAGTWFFSASNGTKKVCCNAISSKCHDQVVADACNSNQPAN